jgi:formate dehydrogenase maturation protein FdhE
MRCAEYKCVSEDAAGWIALLGRDPDERDAPAEMVAVCPVCASREFPMAAKLAETYT